MIAPVDRNFRKRLENRLPSVVNPRHFKEQNILPSTKLALSELLILLIKSEVRIEAFRQKLNRLPKFSKKNIFQIMDKIDKNYLLDSDVNINYFFYLKYLILKQFIAYMNNSAILFIDRDIDFLFIRFDKDRDGRISYSEFYDEVSPKSKEYFYQNIYLLDLLKNKFIYLN